jgi:hypothetical protein
VYHKDRPLHEQQAALTAMQEQREAPSHNCSDGTATQVRSAGVLVQQPTQVYCTCSACSTAGAECIALKLLGSLVVCQF